MQIFRFGIWYGYVHAVYIIVLHCYGGRDASRDTRHFTSTCLSHRTH